jgi:hypothetical protein
VIDRFCDNQRHFHGLSGNAIIVFCKEFISEAY